MEEAGFPPSVFEWQPNPVILAHLQGGYVQSPDPGPFIAKSMSDCNRTSTTEAAERSCPSMAADCNDKGIAQSNQKSPGAPGHTGPVTMPVDLASFVCSQCNYLFNRKFKLKYATTFFLMSVFANAGSKHVIQKHDHHFKCVYQGCGQTFGIRTNLERHEATHTRTNQFQCPNSWCKTPGRTFTREDNLRRHMKLCAAPK